MTAGAAPRRIVVLGGSKHHPGGLEAFCDRATIAINNHAHGWQAEWIPNETAYFKPSRWAAVRDAWREVSRAREVDLIWLQWSTLLDLLFLVLAKRQGRRVLVTPHLGANARLQRVAAARRLASRMLARADRIALLFDGQDREIDIPPCVPRSTIGTFLPQAAFETEPRSRSERSLRLLHAGRLSAGKGTFRMIELCRQLSLRDVPYSALIVGRADEETTTAIRTAITAAGLDDHIVLHDWMPPDDLQQTLNQTDVLVHLSQLDSFPLIVLEAQIAGAVAIVGDMAGAADMVRRYGGVVASEGDVGAAADWLARQDPAAMRQQACNAAAQIRQDYAWETLARAAAEIADQTVEAMPRTEDFSR